MNDTYRLFRSLLFVPGHKKSLFVKAKQSKADILILDIEDAVPEKFKNEACANIAEFAPTYSKNIIVRINEIDHADFLFQLEVLIKSGVQCLMPSKITCAEDIYFLDQLLSILETKFKLNEKAIKFLPLIETISALQNIKSIAKSSGRLVGLAFGGEDYLTELQGSHGERDHTFDYPRTLIALSAKSAGIQAIDTPFLNVENPEGFHERQTKSRDLGFDGCLLIHPSQIDIANECFSPKEDEVRLAREMLKAAEESKKRGLSVTLLNGKLIGPPILKKAVLLLKKNDLCKTRN